MYHINQGSSGTIENCNLDHQHAALSVATAHRSSPEKLHQIEGQRNRELGRSIKTLSHGLSMHVSNDENEDLDPIYGTRIAILMRL